MFDRTDSPVWDAMCKDDEDEKWLKSRPLCSICREHIQDDHYYGLFGRNICESCLKEFKEWID